MNSRTRNALLTLGLVATITTVWMLRTPSVPPMLKLEGKTMGTTYHITYFDLQKRNLQFSVDSLLVLVNKSINTYDSTAEISRFNSGDRSLRFELPYFLPPLRKSREVVAGSNGAYDPTVMPLVNAWGFGPEKVKKPDTPRILRLREYIGFEKVQFNEDSIWKNDPRVQLDFSAIGQGYGADVIGDFFQSKQVNDFFIELGGEGVARGKNLEDNRSWTIGILDPFADNKEQKFKAYATLENQGFSTSGNYFNYREVNGIRYSHTIDPVTGFPVQRELLSATVFARDCATADAWATAFMCMGHVKGIELLKSHPELQVFFIYSSPQGIQTFISEGIARNVEVQP